MGTNSTKVLIEQQAEVDCGSLKDPGDSLSIIITMKA